MFMNKKKPQTENSNANQNVNLNREDTSEFRLRLSIENENVDSKYGFNKVKDYMERTGFLINIQPTEILDEDKRLIAALDLFFIQENNERFKVTCAYKPYFYVLTNKELIQDVSQFLLKKYSGYIASLKVAKKDDLDLANHLIGLKQIYLKLEFFCVSDLIKVKKQIYTAVRKNKKNSKSNTHYMEMLKSTLAVGNDNFSKANTDYLECIIDIREYDVPYHVRVSLDLKIFCGSWYTIKRTGTDSDPPIITPRPDIIERPEPIVMAFDIETTKLPLKFPDATIDQIMMISYMIDGQGFLITNREIVSKDIEDFEFTPKPEFEGKFTIFNEKDELMLLQKFFEHIMDVRPHIIVTYNGDFFDWKFVECRAAVYGIDMKQEIGYSRNNQGVYTCRPSIHMDCLFWVKRDSYLPVGSQGLKAVAKAKLRYDPVELDPEEMCPLAASNPQVLSTYSVSDAVATYYLYMQYVHPFIFALCTIIPCQPEEVLRKGSGTLCESILMVEAFHKNIIFPNKEENVLNKQTEDGHVMLQETYVGGHVEALESGVFRADIPCRFRLVPEAIDKLIESIPKTLEHAIEVEEGIPMGDVLNLDEISQDIRGKLLELKEQPYRLERPLIYHLDVGAMYPNIILTNRLQPCAIVDKTICAACDFNGPEAKCQRDMAWMWRVEYIPATRSEYHRIQHQLETEKFPPEHPGGRQRAFHELPFDKQAEYEKTRLQAYCRKVYKKQKVTKVEEKITTVCQKENSFYVDTVRAFRDRRYEYKAKSKKAKQRVIVALKKGDPTEIKSAKNCEVLFDSLQLAHKCILNSFYGYVMRRGARWYSMEMAGIVCHTGANIIMKAREIIEEVGRPLELDTDGIWCILPISFPETITVHTKNASKSKINVSYPNAVLNAMVKEYFTNDQYHELIDADKRLYERRSENTIFFEVDGPYKAMVLPASKEEGKKIKKRYAVFNFDGSLAELKGFEVKRRGELQLIKNFQSSVFEAFLNGDTLETCYAAVAKVANYWLDVLYSKGANLPDDELFELICENRSMSKTLAEYGAQKSTSISTAKRLAEFLGDQMVKDAGLACKYIIARKPEGAPVTERAIPLAIFQSEESIQKTYLRRWLKDDLLNEVEIRDILDWNYYVERLGGAIQKIITIPAAMQGINNPVPRIKHPDWLHKKVLEKTSSVKQRRIDDIFNVVDKNNVGDIEDLERRDQFKKPAAIVTTTISSNTNKRKRNKNSEFEDMDLTQSWREVLGTPPNFGVTKEEHITWLMYHKKKWRYQMFQRKSLNQQQLKRFKTDNGSGSNSSSSGIVRSSTNTLSSFLQKSQRALISLPWQILQIASTNKEGEFKLWALVNTELHLIKLNIPKIFYLNIRTENTVEPNNTNIQKCHKTLPRGKQVYNLYRYALSHEIYAKHMDFMCVEQNDPNIEGIYELQVPTLFRAYFTLGCVCHVLPKGKTKTDTFELDDLETTALFKQYYLGKDKIKRIYLYQHRANVGVRQMFGLFLTPIKKALIIVVDSVKTNLMPNMNTLYQAEHIVRKQKLQNDDAPLPPNDVTFEVHVESNLTQVYKQIQKWLRNYKDEKKGPTILAVQSCDGLQALLGQMPFIGEFPNCEIHIQDIEELYNNLEWQKIGAKVIVRHYLNSERVLDLMTEQSRYFHLPLGNMQQDSAIFGADLFYARHLNKHNHLLWCSKYDYPDLGRTNVSNSRLLTDINLMSNYKTEICNSPGWYSSVCVELDIESLVVTAILQAPLINDLEGNSYSSSFGNNAVSSLDDMISKNAETVYDETAQCTEAFRILRIMATVWMRDISLNKNPFADFQVLHLYRWLRSSKSLLYDPALLRTVQILMKKLSLHLVAELKHMGCTIVYATFNKIIVCSKRRNVKDALANIEFVVASIRNKEIFHSLDITYKQCWELLIWQDASNYAGIQGKLTEDNDVDNVNHGESDNLYEESDERNDDSNEPYVIMNWNINKKIPEKYGCRESFNAVIAGYVHAIYMKLKDIQSNDHNETDSVTTATPLSQPNLNLTAYNSVLEYAKDLISNELSQNLFRITEKINNKLEKEDALIFVKTVCHVLSLDKSTNEEVQRLKSNLLRLISVNEYSNAADWQDMTKSYILPQVICKVCNNCRDIDLARDINVGDCVWLCPTCKTPYDNVEIESSLLEILSRQILTYNLQDLRCQKCRMIKRENLPKHCNCAGEFSCLMDKSDLINLIEIFKDISLKFKMYVLNETTENLLLMA